MEEKPRFKAQELIKQAIERHRDKIAVACSFGKDSIVVLHMALKVDPNVKVIFENTGVEFPETIEYMKKITKEWNLNLIETKPIKSFWQCIKEYGLPTVRKSKGKGSNSPKCCFYCKEKPAEKVFKEHKIQAIITGILKCESQNRGFLIGRYDKSTEEKDHIKFCGQRYFMKTTGMWKIHPIAYWSEEEVWDYIKENNIPINPVYTKWDGLYKRCGCLPCTAYLDWEKKLSISHPQLYKKLKDLSSTSTGFSSKRSTNSSTSPSPSSIPRTKSMGYSNRNTSSSMDNLKLPSNFNNFSHNKIGGL